jgi:hypothetical protein
MILIMIWWFVSAHKWFKGPHINVEHAMLGRNDVVEGIAEHESTSDVHSVQKKDDGETPKTAAISEVTA